LRSVGRGEDAAVAAAYDFSRAPTIIDLGGGQGGLLAAILRAAPEARGTLFDLPHVMDAARRQVEQAGVATRVRLETTCGPIRLQRPDGAMATLVLQGQPDRAVALKRRETSELIAEELRRLDPDDTYASALRFGVDRLGGARPLVPSPARVSATASSAVPALPALPSGSSGSGYASSPSSPPLSSGPSVSAGSSSPSVSSGSPGSASDDGDGGRPTPAQMPPVKKVATE